MKKDKIVNILQWLLVAVIALGAGVLVLSNFDTPLQLRVFSVNSGSMEPALHVGSLVFVRPKDSYAEQDIITYRSRRDPNQTTTHRIERINFDADLGRTTFVTKGDANDSPDASLTLESQIIGKVLLAIPLIGYLVAFVKTQLGFTFLIVIPATIVIYSEAQNIKKELASGRAARKAAKKATAPSKSGDKITAIGVDTPKTKAKAGSKSGRKTKDIKKAAKKAAAKK